MLAPTAKKKFIIGEQIGNFSRDMEIMEKTNKWKFWT